MNIYALRGMATYVNDTIPWVPRFTTQHADLATLIACIDNAIKASRVMSERNLQPLTDRVRAAAADVALYVARIEYDEPDWPALRTRW